MASGEHRACDRSIRETIHYDRLRAHEDGIHGFLLSFLSAFYPFLSRAKLWDHRLLRTTNSVERLNEEIRRRDRGIQIYPNRTSCERLLGVLLMEFDEAMSSGKVYLDMREYHAWRGSRDALRDAEGPAAAFRGQESEVLVSAG